VKITLVTERPTVGDQEANLKRVEKGMAEADGDVVVFGELFLPGYMAKDDHVRLAVDLKRGDVVGRLKDAATTHDRNLIVGLTRRDPDVRGVCFDSMALVTRKGKVDWYDKWYLANFGPFEERLFFDEGERLKLWDVDGLRVGPQICYDLFFPELTKAYALMGADMIVNVSASPNVSRTFFETLFPARAIETGCFFAYCNVAGSQEDLVFWGGSQLWGPRGDLKVRAPYFDPSVVTYELDPEELRTTRPLRPTARDTRKGMIDAMRKALGRLQKR
jgi:predicted amidohydrolase